MPSLVGASLLAIKATRCFRLKHRVTYNLLAINPAKELPMAFKLIEHVTSDLILSEAHPVSYTHLTLPTICSV